MQFRENLSDRQAADAVRARIDWKYLLALDLADPGFDHSVLCEFRARLVGGEAGERLLSRVLDAAREAGLLKARGRQRTDSTHVLAAVRELNRVELLAETLRAALNVISIVAADWLRQVAEPDWHKLYNRRVEETRLPPSGPTGEMVQVRPRARRTVQHKTPAMRHGIDAHRRRKDGQAAVPDLHRLIYRPWLYAGTKVGARLDRNWERAESRPSHMARSA
jgi:IS5 family transposase